jgi:hypothetical protein
MAACCGPEFNSTREASTNRKLPNTDRLLPTSQTLPDKLIQLTDPWIGLALQIAEANEKLIA